MKKLITGGGGFIGSHLARKLITKNETVLILDDFSSGSIENLNEVIESSNFQYISGSILDENLVAKIMSEVDYCYHLAASLGVEKINSDPISAINVNLKGCEIVLKHASRFNVRTFLASSSEIYGKNTKVPLSEEYDRVLGPPQIARWSYSEAKAMDELYAFQLHAKESFPVTIGRFFNTVGIRQSGAYGMVLPRFIEAALKNNPLLVYGDGKQTRSFCAVSDAVSAIDELMSTSNTIGQVYNIGSPNEISINDLAKLVIEVTNSKSEIVYKKHSEIFGNNFEEPFRRSPNIFKITKAVGWQPKKNLQEIILEIVRHKKND